MYKAQTHYRAVSIASRIEAATPHELVAILYEELIGALDVARAAVVQGKASACHSARDRSVSILLALEASLDLERGGDLARSLAGIYGAIRLELIRRGRELQADTLDRASKSVAALQEAWARIAIREAA